MVDEHEFAVQLLLELSSRFYGPNGELSTSGCGRQQSGHRIGMDIDFWPYSACYP